MIEGEAADASCGKFLNDQIVLHVRQGRKNCTSTGQPPANTPLSARSGGRRLKSAKARIKSDIARGSSKDRV